MRIIVPHILIIDADLGVARSTYALMARIIEAILTVETTLEGARMNMQSHPAHVVIIDPLPYYLASTRLIQWLKSEYTGTYIIVLTSATMPALRRTLQALPIDLYLEKREPLAVITHQLRIVLQKVVASS